MIFSSLSNFFNFSPSLGEIIGMLLVSREIEMVTEGVGVTEDKFVGLVVVEVVLS